MPDVATNTTPDELRATIGHELRSPLTGLLGMLEILTDPDAHVAADEAREMLELAHREAKELSILVDSLTSHRRLERSPTREAVAIGPLIRQVLAMFPRVEARAIVTAPDDLAVLAHHESTRRILANLLQNIDRYAPDGTVEIVARPTGDNVEVLVADEGPGLGSTDSAGLGLGLTLSSRLATEMGGSLRPSDKQLRKGAAMRLVLPRAHSSPAPPVVSGTADLAAPRARLVAQLVEAFEEHSIERVTAGIGKLAHDLLGSAGVIVVVGGPEEATVVGAPSGDESDPPEELWVTRPSWMTNSWLTERTAGIGYVVPLRSGLLIIGWGEPENAPRHTTVSLAPHLATLTEAGIDRVLLAGDVETERDLRSAVLESLPLGISIFAGDPPVLIDMNEAERTMLGIEGPERDPNLAASQAQFDVRFMDGTPLDMESAPVALAIRTGSEAGPFYLRVRRPDGSEYISRTYCAPFLRRDGSVAGAVVTAEEIDPDRLPELD